MKKLVATSLVIALLGLVPVTAVHAEKAVKEEGKGKGGGGKEEKGGGSDNDNKGNGGKDEKDESGKGKPDEGKDNKKDGNDQSETEIEIEIETEIETETETSIETSIETTTETSTETPATSQHPGKKEAVQKAVKTKKELIELRQQLKHATEVTEELKAKYEELTKQLEEQTELKQALEVQKELLDRFYKPGDTTMYEKLGELYEKAGDTSLKTFINGEEVPMDAAPFIEKGRALVPVRAVSASLKAEVSWNADSRTVEIVRGESKITLYLDSGEAEVNGTKTKLETAPVIKNGRVFLPLRFIGEQLNAKVGYQKEGDLIIIEDGQQTEEEPVAEGEETGTGDVVNTEEGTSTDDATTDGTTTVTEGATTETTTTTDTTTTADTTETTTP